MIEMNTYDSGQIDLTRPKRPPISVAFGKGNPRNFQGNRSVGEI